MHKAWVGFRDSRGRLLGARLLEARMSGVEKAVEVTVRGKLKIAILDEGIRKASVYTIVLEEGIGPPTFDVTFAGKCPSGNMAFKTINGKIVRFGRDNSLVPVPKLDLPNGLQSKSTWEEIEPGIFQKM